MTKIKLFLSDEDASMVLEFVVVLPLLIVWMVGCVVFFDAYKAKADADTAAYIIADILSRHEQLNMADINEMANLQGILASKADGPIWMRVSVIEYDEDDDSYSVLFSKIPNGMGGSELIDADIPVAQLWNMYDGETVLLIDATVPYIPMVDWVRIGARNWETRAVISPRASVEILWCGALQADPQCVIDAGIEGTIEG